MGTLLNIFPLFARVDLQLDKTHIGTVLFLRALFMMLGFVALGHSAFWHFRGWPVLVGQAALGVCVGLMVFARDAVTLSVLFSVAGFAMAMAYAASLFHGAAGSGNRRARSAIHESLLATGQVGGSLIGGLLYTHFSMSWTFRFCMAIVLGGLLAQAVMCAWAKRERRLSA